MTRYVTDRLVAAASLSVGGALVALFAGLPEVALFVAPWFALLALGLAQRPGSSVEVDVEVSADRVVLGDDVDVTAWLSADGPVIAKVTPTYSDDVRASETANRQRNVQAIVAGSRSDIAMTVTTASWGSHDLAAMVIELTQPFGLFRSRVVPTAKRMVRVHPAKSQLNELLAPRRVRRLSGTHQSRDAARGIEYADIREFAAGDSVRDINWRVSARSNELWVSQRHPDRATDVVLLVDSFVESGHDARQVFGLVIRSAVALAEAHLGATDRVGLLEFGGVVRWIGPSTGRVQLERLTDALLATGLYENAAARELPDLPRRALPPRSFVIAFTPLLDDRFVEALFTARARGHDVAVIECAPDERDERLEEQSVAAVSRRIYAAERTMLRDRMAERGIAIAPWDGEAHLDLVLSELLRRRRGALHRGVQ